MATKARAYRTPLHITIGKKLKERYPEALLEYDSDEAPEGEPRHAWIARDGTGRIAVLTGGTAYWTHTGTSALRDVTRKPETGKTRGNNTGANGGERSRGRDTRRA